MQKVYNSKVGCTRFAIIINYSLHQFLQTTPTSTLLHKSIIMRTSTSLTTFLLCGLATAQFGTDPLLGSMSGMTCSNGESTPPPPPPLLSGQKNPPHS